MTTKERRKSIHVYPGTQHEIHHLDNKQSRSNLLPNDHFFQKRPKQLILQIEPGSYLNIHRQ